MIKPNAVTEENRTEDTCPWCGGPIIWKTPRWRKPRMFLACSNFPDCKWTSARSKNGLPLRKPGRKKG